MNKTVSKLGYLSALLCMVSFIIWIVSFVGIAVSSPLFQWTGMNDYINFIQSYDQFFQNFAKAFMIVFALSYAVLMFSLYEFVDKEKKILSNIALAFGLMFVLSVSIHYFLQLTAVRFAISDENYSGLEHFLQANPTSASSSVNMLGWTIFLGLSSLFFYFALRPKSLIKGIRIAFLITAVSCLSGAVGFLFQIDIITFITINLGMGFGMILLSISGIKFFK